jgi:hypothetical protein
MLLFCDAVEGVTESGARNADGGGARGCADGGLLRDERDERRERPSRCHSLLLLVGVAWP